MNKKTAGDTPNKGGRYIRLKAGGELIPADLYNQRKKAQPKTRKAKKD